MKSKIIKYKDDIIEIIVHPRMKVLPGQLAFFFVLALVPTITMIAYFAKFFAVSLNGLGAYYDLGRYVNFKSLLKPIEIRGNVLHYLIMLLMTVYISSNGMHSLIITSNHIYGIKEYNFLKDRLKSFVIFLIIVFLFMIVLVLPVLGSIALDILSYFPKYKLILAFLKLFRYPVLFLIIFIFIKIIYVIAPDKKIKPKSVNVGAAICSFGWIIATSVYICYIQYFADYYNYYNALADFIALMFLVYILAYIFVVCLALNAKMEKSVHKK